MNSATIEVSHKPGVLDPAAQGVLVDLRLIGQKTVKRVETAQLYKLVGKLSEAERTRAGEQLLKDPVIQLSRVVVEEKLSEKSVVIDVWYKSGVTDVVGDSVLKGLRDIGIEGVSEVRTGSRFRLWGVRNSAEAQLIADTILANPLIQDRIIHAS